MAYKILLIIVCILMIGSADVMADNNGAMDNSNLIIRQPAVSGTFYPSDSAELAGIVAKDLANVTGLPEIDGQIIAIIVPHAGIQYSGPVAAYAYKLLENSGINKVFICGGAHHYPYEGVSVYGPGVAWKNPLGIVSCNDDLCRQLIDAENDIRVLPEAHSQEHSLEMQLPFLQAVLHNFTIIPALIGFQRPKAISDLAKAMDKIKFDSSMIMVASSDWQHYLPASEGWKYDSLGMECLKNFDIASLEKYLSEDKVKMCGYGAVLAVLKAARRMGADRIKILKHGDSGDLSGDKSSVVGYVAAVVYKSNGKELPAKAILSDDEKQTLLKLARETIETYLSTGKTPKHSFKGVLNDPGAAFVTLEEHDQLRGCIGLTQAIQPLNETVSYCAIQAAVADPRFPPVKSSELNDIHIEISVLTPLQEVKSLDEIKVGRDGLIIERGSRRGLLLPQVATDYNWNREEFLQNTCRKAGLPADAYKSPDAKIYKFQAVVFSEPK